MLSYAMLLCPSAVRPLLWFPPCVAQIAVSCSSCSPSDDLVGQIEIVL